MSGETGLYPRLLGDEGWHSLAPAVRALHSSEPPAEHTGTFEVVRGRSLLSRLTAWLMRVPAAGKRVPVELRVKASARSDVWQRSFAGQPLVTEQYERPSGILAERMGPVECRFRLETRGGALTFRQVGAAFCLGRVALPLPRWLAPKVRAVARPGAEPGEVHVEIAIAAPLAGDVIAYRGAVRIGTADS